MFLDRLQASRAWAAVGSAAAGLLISTSSGAQPAPAGAASAPAAELSPTERAQRDADKVFKWILIHSDKPRKASPPRDEKRDDKPAVATRAKPAARAAEPPAATASPAATPAATVVSTPASTPASTETATAPAAASATPLATALPATRPAETAPPAAAPPAAIEVARAPASVPPPVTEERDEPLRPLVRTDPKFPPSLLRTLVKGQVQVSFTVLPDGSVAEPSVVTTTDSRLRPAALAAVAQWRFAPLRKAQTGVVDLVFNLE